MITESFREQVLLNPLREGYTELFIVSGYASAVAALQHLTGGSYHEDPKIPKHGRLTLVVGMYLADGIRRSDHELFLDLCHRYDNFECRYVTTGAPVHSKAYVWLKKGSPLLAYIGSANYTLAASRCDTRELLSTSDPNETYQYCKAIYTQSIHCTEVKELLVRSEYRTIKRVSLEKDLAQDYLTELPSVKLPLTAHGKEEAVPLKSGLNWGQRAGREPNQAYISVPGKVQALGFFPPRGEYFTVITDDGNTFQMSRRQDNGKALHTPNNSDLGRYFRKRLRLPEGSLVTINDLLAYGRTDVTFYYLGDDTYYMDFSV